MYPNECVMCRGEVIYIGTLGIKHWGRCQYCGMDQWTEAALLEEVAA